MQARFEQKEFVPFFIHIGKCLRDICTNRPERACNRRFNKKPVFEQGYMVADAVCGEQLEAIPDLFIICIEVRPSERNNL